MTIKKFPIVLALFRDKTIDVSGVDKAVVGFMWIRKGRTLTITGVDPTKRFTVEMGPRSVIRGDVRLAKKPTEMTVDQLREHLSSSESSNEKEGKV